VTWAPGNRASKAGGMTGGNKVDRFRVDTSGSAEPQAHDKGRAPVDRLRSSAKAKAKKLVQSQRG